MKKKFIKILLIIPIIILMNLFTVSCSGKWAKISEIKLIFPVASVGFIDKENGITVGSYGETNYTSDGGITWIPAENVPVQCYQIDIIDKNTAFSSGWSGLVITENGGKNWTQLNEISWKILSFSDINTGWLADENAKMISTDDKGITWQEIILPEDIKTISAISRIDKNSGFVMDDSGNLYLTHDNGAHWEKIKVKADNKNLLCKRDTLSMRFKNNNEGIIIIRKNNDNDQWLVLTTKNCGKNWQKTVINEKISGLYISKDLKYITFCSISSPAKVSIYNIK